MQQMQRWRGSGGLKGLLRRTIVLLLGITVAVSNPAFSQQPVAPPDPGSGVGNNPPLSSDFGQLSPDGTQMKVGDIDPSGATDQNSNPCIVSGMPLTYGNPYYVAVPPVGQSATYTLYDADGMPYALALTTLAPGYTTAAMVDGNGNSMSIFFTPADGSTTTTKQNSDGSVTTITKYPGPPKTIRVSTLSSTGETTLITVTQQGDGTWTGTGWYISAPPAIWYFTTTVTVSADGNTITIAPLVFHSNL